MKLSNKLPHFFILSLLFHIGCLLLFAFTIGKNNGAKMIDISFGSGQNLTRAGAEGLKTWPASKYKKIIHTTTNPNADAAKSDTGVVGSGDGIGSGSGSGSSSSEGRIDFRARYFDAIRKLVSEKKRYPLIAQKLNQQGVVILRLTLNKKGQLLKVDLVSPSQHKLLNESAIDVVKSIEIFPELPIEMQEEEISFNVPFDYKIDTF